MGIQCKTAVKISQLTGAVRCRCQQQGGSVTLDIYNVYVRCFGLAVGAVASKVNLDCPVGLPTWPAGHAWASVLPTWASVLPFLACRTPSGRQLGANWAPIGRQLDAKLDCQNGCQCQRTS